MTCPSNLSNVADLLNFASCTIANAVVPLLVAIAVAFFIWGIITYFLNPDNEEKKKEGKSYLLWGLIALFVMTSFWGLVNILSNTFDTGNNNKINMPGLPIDK